ncbi:hypothetical protein ACIA8O_16195 [Kitasatospora sp. NPDC051853]|uniref:hypothetical protein n=1 Tax=Kitasatospora sp. NPDC051853 TaxID=3364058 RepID=UPI0037A6676A
MNSAADGERSVVEETARFAACGVNGVPGVMHALGARGTLCGTAARYITVYLMLFEPAYLASCRRCRRLVEEAVGEG